jgi:hypothetical protein
MHAMKMRMILNIRLALVCQILGDETRPIFRAYNQRCTAGKLKVEGGTRIGRSSSRAISHLSRETKLTKRSQIVPENVEISKIALRQNVDAEPSRDRLGGKNRRPASVASRKGKNGHLIARVISEIYQTKPNSAGKSSALQNGKAKRKPQSFDRVRSA